ncbi:hypothetical protein ACWDYJ_18510 [Streptomyces sp. NPDC003042]
MGRRYGLHPHGDGAPLASTGAGVTVLSGGAVALTLTGWMLIRRSRPVPTA